MTDVAKRFVSKRMVAVLNRMCVQLTGGMSASRTNLRPGTSLGFVERIRENEFFGERLYPDVFHQAAAYMFHVIKDHVFLDGNKRTGLAAAVTLLEWNGVRLEPFDEESAYAFVIQVASGPNDPARALPRIAKWLEDQTRDVSRPDPRRGAPRPRG